MQPTRSLMDAVEQPGAKSVLFGKITIGSLSAATVRQGGLLVPYPHYTGVNQIRASVGDSVYHGFTLRAERSFEHGLMFQASFTGAKLIDNVNERFLGGTNDVNPYDLSMSRFILRGGCFQTLCRQLHLRVAHRTWQERAVKRRRRWIGNWQTSGILSAQTGTPISIGAACSFPGVSGLGCYANRLRDGNIPSSEQSMNRWLI